MWNFIGVSLVILATGAVAVAFLVRRKNLHRWLTSYVFAGRSSSSLYRPEPSAVGALDLNPGVLAGRRDVGCGRCAAAWETDDRSNLAVWGTPFQRFRNSEELHVFIAVGDHYEPDNAKPARHVADARVARWCDEYPRLFGQFEDCRGRSPQHTFFYPEDEYFVPAYLDDLKHLCDQGFGDVEVHLHHDHDTEDALREKLESFCETLVNRHGLLRRDPMTQEIRYGFIHGNWALCNSRPDGRWCGVNDELTILRETGCYADFTMPSAPEVTQTQIINSIYYAASDARRSGSHDRGTHAALGVVPPQDQLLMIQGPLRLDWVDRTRGVMPRIENGDLLHRRPPTWRRFEQWLRCGVHVTGRPDWCFVKLHTHGCKDGNIDMWLGDDTVRFHHQLATYSSEHPSFHYYYVTAWEMAQLVQQAEAGIKKPVFEDAMVLN